MKYKIVFDPEKRILKAILKGKRVPLPEVSDKELKRANGGKAPKYPRGMSPSPYVWGVIKHPKRIDIVTILVPKPISELGPKEGRITGRTRSGKPIYGGFYSILHYAKGGEISQQDVDAFINSEEFDEINERYKEKGFETLSKNPVLVDIRTGKLVKTIPRTSHSEAYVLNRRILEKIPKEQPDWVTDSKTTEIFDKLTLNSTAQQREVSNAQHPNLIIERKPNFCGFQVFSFAQYERQGSKKMADPKMEFIRIIDKDSVAYMPIEVKNDYLHVDKRFIPEGEEIPLRMDVQIKDLAPFADKWAQTLEEQGFVKSIE